MRVPGVAVLLVGLGLVAAGCASGSDGTPVSPSRQSGQTAATAVPDVPTSPQDPSAGVTTTPLADAPAAVSLELVEVATFEQPLDLTWAPDGTGPYVAEKTGRVRLLDESTGESELILDLSDAVSTDSERGLLGTTFSPDGAWFYANYNALDGTSHLTAWEWTGQPLDPSEGREIMTVRQPFSNHNGGGLEFGPDGLLYWSLGDGGSGGDPEGNGQDTSTPLGAILRIDPQPSTGGYDIPADNPFAADAGAAQEIWQYGLRNPWRFSFDRLTGDLWIGDVGQGEFEEIDVAPAGVGGLNFGWNCFEGVAVFSSCDPIDSADPLLAYDHSLGQSVTGGYVYRGTAEPALVGSYVFGDFGSGILWTLPDGAAASIDTGVRVPGLGAFGEDPDGELWTVSLNGAVSRLTG